MHRFSFIHSQSWRSFRNHWLLIFCSSFLFLPHLAAQPDFAVRGEVLDPLGARVAHASVDLIEGGKVVAHTDTGNDGRFQLDAGARGSYRVRVQAASFETTTTALLSSGDAARMPLEITLATATLTQAVTVTATGVPMPQAQTGADVTVLPSAEFRFQPDVQDPLRLVAGLEITQVGQLGSSTGLNIRGAANDANKVLIDGVPANAIGGNVEFANLANVGIDAVEVLREPNSALYGSDALAGVVSLRSARGSTASGTLPLFTYAGDAGDFHTYRNEVTAGTVYRHFDLYSAFARIQTSNSLPNSEFHNATYAGNFGWAPNSANDLRFSIRHIVDSEGQPNAIAFYGIADDGQEKEQDNYYNAVWNNQTTSRWHNQVRYGGVRQASQYSNFGATGILDQNTGYYDGARVTIKGANGYTVTGQAVFQYSGRFSGSTSTTKRDFVYAQTDVQVTPHLLALGAFKYENESGSAVVLPAGGTPPSYIERGNYSYTAQFSGDVRNRLFYNLGTGLEDNGLFGFAATPRASVAYYLARPSTAGFFSGTKLHGTFGKGIKEPSVYQQAYSLYGTLSAPTQTNGAALIAKYGVTPLNAENSRTYDAGLDQQIGHGRGRMGLTYFHNEFTHGVEYVPQSGLLQLGISAANLPAFQYGGAYINSLAFRTMGLEFESEYKVNRHIFARGGYTYTDGVVQRSFSSDSLFPSFNLASNFKTTPIGAYSPLVGARPFRVAPHTGYFGLSYTASKLYASLTGTLVGKRDDSDFLSDTNFDTTLLLPNRNLDGAYQRLDLGTSYQLHPRVKLYANVQNLLSEHYQEAFGYPALPLNVRAGVKVSFGGESWKLK